MITYDDTAAVYEAWTNADCSEYLGCFDTYTEARAAINEAAR